MEGRAGVEDMTGAVWSLKSGDEGPIWWSCRWVFTAQEAPLKRWRRTKSDLGWIVSSLIWLFSTEMKQECLQSTADKKRYLGRHSNYHDNLACPVFVRYRSIMVCVEFVPEVSNFTMTSTPICDNQPRWWQDTYATVSCIYKSEVNPTDYHRT